MIGHPLYPTHGDEYTQAMERAIAEYKAWEQREMRFYVFRRKLKQSA